MKKTITTLLMLALTANISAQQKPPMSFDLGTFTITVLPEQQGEGNPNILIGATNEMIRQTMPNGTYPNAVNAFLVQTHNKTVLFDTGFGRNLINNLQAKGKSPADIDIVMMTHLHGDHIGGLLTNGIPTFPNAQLYIAKAEHDYWMSDAEMNRVPENRRNSFTSARAVINAYSDKLIIFVPQQIANAQELIPGIRAVAAYGHTPGHTGYLIESNGDRLFIWGDLTHAMAIQIPFPQVAVTFDVNPTQAVETRTALLEYLFRNDIQVAGMHIEFPGIGNVQRGRNGGYNFVLICECLGQAP